MIIWMVAISPRANLDHWESPSDEQLERFLVVRFNPNDFQHGLPIECNEALPELHRLWYMLKSRGASKTI
ncbi:MAG: hypothetical protein C5B53_07500 [Candidatus Melainabacteria bacterium]|nr:MAG: hypothetical protein C5B53_07500 [Candidatus Melainabacteria bacterium]